VGGGAILLGIEVEETEGGRQRKERLKDKGGRLKRRRDTKGNMELRNSGRRRGSRKNKS
jgi:hypothetical protein